MPESVNPGTSSCRRPSAVHSILPEGEAVRRTAVAPGASSISRGPSSRLFQCATTREGRVPGGLERAAIPYDVRVRTVDPGSFARMLA